MDKGVVEWVPAVEPQRIKSVESSSVSYDKPSSVSDDGTSNDSDDDDKSNNVSGYKASDELAGLDFSVTYQPPRGNSEPELPLIDHNLLL